MTDRQNPEIVETVKTVDITPQRIDEQIAFAVATVREELLPTAAHIEKYLEKCPQENYWPRDIVKGWCEFSTELARLLIQEREKQFHTNEDED